MQCQIKVVGSNCLNTKDASDVRDGSQKVARVRGSATSARRSWWRIALVVVWAAALLAAVAVLHGRCPPTAIVRVQGSPTPATGLYSSMHGLYSVLQRSACGGVANLAALAAKTAPSRAPAAVLCHFAASGALTDLRTACSPGLQDGACEYFFTSDCKQRRDQNTLVLSSALENAPPGTVLYIANSTFHVNGGVGASHVEDVTVQLDGTLDFGGPRWNPIPRLVRDAWPGFNTTDPGHSHVKNMIEIKSFKNLKLTSSGVGTIDGGGANWWSLASDLQIGLQHVDAGVGTNKPAMLVLGNTTADPNPSRGLEVARIWLKDSGYWTTRLLADDVHIHHTNVTARQVWKGHKPSSKWRRAQDWFDEMSRMLTFNTDGLDVVGNNVHIHDCIIDVEDDCIGMKGGRDWLVEDVQASGLGITVGTLMFGRDAGPNVTFRNIDMFETLRAIYVKPNFGRHVTGVVYENMTIGTAYLFPIWIGPAYQELNSGCPLPWPWISPAHIADIRKYLPSFNIDSLCTPTDSPINVTLTNITVQYALTAPKVLYGTHLNVTQIDVRVVNTPGFDGEFPFAQLPNGGNVDSDCRRAGQKIPPTGFGHCCDGTVFNPTVLPWGQCDAKEI